MSTMCKALDHTQKKRQRHFFFCSTKANLDSRGWKGMDEMNQGKASTMIHSGVLNGSITSQHTMTEHMPIADQKGRKGS